MGGSTSRTWWKRPGLWVVTYVALLIASHIVQIVSPHVWIPLPERIGEKFVEVAQTTSKGPIAGRTMRVGYLEWPSSSAAPIGAPERPPVLLLHGSPGQAFDFVRLGPELGAAGYRALAIDLPGFGNSQGLIVSYSNRAHAHALFALMDELGIERAHVVGWSNGGGVGLNMADIAPDRLASFTLLAATGVQETEGSGAFYFEHAKYLVAYAAAVVAPELIPHFGIIGERKLRHAFVRSFLDTDQRPIRAIMGRLRVPTMVLHGRGDVLVSFAGALEHHRLIRDSRLVVLDANHFLPFLQARETTGQLATFFARHDAPGVPPESAVIDLSGGPTRFDTMLAGIAAFLVRTPWWVEAIAVGMLAFVSWPLTLAAAALLVATMNLDFGIVLLGLMVGRALRSRPRASLRAWTRIVVTSIFGLLVAQAGATFIVQPLAEAIGWIGVIFGLPLVAICVWMLPRIFTWRGRASIHATISRFRHHEYWPSWFFYTPLVPYILGQAARRGGLLSPTCCNPGVGKGGGLVGESKSEILRSMDDPSVLAHTLVPGGSVSDERDRARRAIESIDNDPRLGGWPIILKPDSGQRGFAVRLARTPDDVERYFQHVHGPVIVQQYHAGPHECGVLWVRGLSASRRAVAGVSSNDAASLVGGIYAVTRKEFSFIDGDGQRTLERLILNHPRYRCQAAVFLSRFTDARTRIPAAGERVRLAEAGNHCQGTLFRDGSDLISPALEARIDAIASRFTGPNGAGFDFGRFDLRFTSEETLRRGEGFGIVELNGVTSEATNLYDPDRGPFWAYSVLFGQWRELYRIGHVRRQEGIRPLTLRETLAYARSHFGERTGSPLAD